MLAGLSGVRYGLTGTASFEREPPVLALGIALLGLGAGLWLRTRAALLLARAALISGGVWVGVKAIRHLVGAVGGGDADEALVAHAYLFGSALAIAGLVLLWLLVRRVKVADAFGGADLVPIGALVLAGVAAVIWLVSDGARLRPCHLRNYAACDLAAQALLRSADRVPASRPSRGEEQAGRLLATQSCSSDDPMQCGTYRYAAGTVEARAGRADTAKEALLAACDIDRRWCARALTWALPWTPEERARLDRR